MRLNLLLLSLLLLTLVSGQSVYDEDWVNVFQQSFNFQCPHGEMLVAVRSYFSAAKGSDRLWVFQCWPLPHDLGEPTECWWDDINRAGMEWRLVCVMCRCCQQTGHIAAPGVIYSAGTKYRLMLRIAVCPSLLLWSSSCLSLWLTHRHLLDPYPVAYCDPGQKVTDILLDG